jgi:hypothetical protein
MMRIEGLDTYCPYMDAEIFEQYNVTIAQTSATYQNYHVLQILTKNKPNGDKQYIVWNRCGVYHNQDYTDYRTQIYQDMYDTPFEAVDKFFHIFKTKTKTEFLDESAKPRQGAYVKLT